MKEKETISKHLSQINETSRENLSSDLSKLKEENISYLKENLNSDLYHRSLSDSQDNIIYDTSKKIEISPKSRSCVFFFISSFKYFYFNGSWINSSINK